MTTPRIAFSDRTFAVVWKPAGLMVEPDRFGHPNLLDWVAAQMPRKPKWGPHPIHRLDRPTCGWVVVTWSKTMFTSLSQQWENRTVEKTYRLLTSNAVQGKSGEFVDTLFKDPFLKKAAVVPSAHPEGKSAVLHYQFLRKISTNFLYEVALKTGRYHQIRAQFSHRGAPLLGDAHYGNVHPYAADGIALCAGKLVFQHPKTNEKLTFEQWPQEFGGS